MRVILFIFAVLAIVLGVVDAREDRVARLKRKLLARQAPFNGPTTVTTTRTAQTFAGTVVETCNITLTPVVANGQSMVKEEKNCSVELVRSSSSVPVSTASLTSSVLARPVSTSTLVVTVTATASSSVANSAVSTTSEVSTSTAPASTATTTSSASPSSTTSSVAIATSSSVATSTSQAVTSSTTQAVTSSTTQAASSTTTQAASSTTTQATSSTAAGGERPASEIGTKTVTGSSLPPASTTVTTPLAVSATPAQAEASPSTTEFTLPGKKLEVLPIGLGVFAGISVIALVVVGLVTYERTKYRKAFRQRRLAEQGAGMGYNGMSERV